MNSTVCTSCGSEPQSKAQFCFTCWFWLEKTLLFQMDPQHHIVANGNFYRIGARNAPGPRGYAGARVLVEWLDTEDRLVTDNLWTCGRIPDQFRHRLPDTTVLRWL